MLRSKRQAIKFMKEPKKTIGKIREGFGKSKRANRRFRNCSNPNR